MIWLEYFRPVNNNNNKHKKNTRESETRQIIKFWNYTPTEKIFENSSREEKEKNTLLKSLVT